MKTLPRFNGVSELEPKAALVVYTSHDSATATIHLVREGLIQPGRPAEREEIIGLLEVINQSLPAVGWVDNRILYLSSEKLIWWRTPRPATLIFQTRDTKLNALSGKE